VAAGAEQRKEFLRVRRRSDQVMIVGGVGVGGGGVGVGVGGGEGDVRKILGVVREWVQ